MQTSEAPKKYRGVLYEEDLFTQARKEREAVSTPRSSPPSPDPPKDLYSTMASILLYLSEVIPRAEPPSVLDHIAKFGFDSRQDVENVLGYFGYDLFRTAVLQYWHPDAPFVDWFEEFSRKSHRKVKLSEDAKKGYFTRLQENAKEILFRKRNSAEGLTFDMASSGTEPPQNSKPVSEKRSVKKKRKALTLRRKRRRMPVEDGYTSADSSFSDKLGRNDYKLLQVKTISVASSPRITQYWYRRGKRFEHLVLAKTKPSEWRRLRIDDFHINVADISEVTFAKDDSKVAIELKNGGFVMAEFNTERGRKRFLEDLGIQTPKRKIESVQISSMWNLMTPKIFRGS